MISEILISSLFGIGTALTFLGILLFHQIFVKRVNFNSHYLMVQVAFISMFIGITLIHLVYSIS